LPAQRSSEALRRSVELAQIEALLTGVDPDRLRGNLRMLY